MNITQKIIASHLQCGKMNSGEEVGIRIDQTLTQDATGTMVYLEFEAIGLDRVMTDISISYVDHNMLQVGYENPDDHRFLQSTAARYGLVFSKPGNGICHQLHLERFGVPGGTLMGSDSHTPTGGGLGMLSIGAGGIQVAAAMAGEPFLFQMPKVYQVYLRGRLRGWATAKDVIHEVLRRLSVKGGRGFVMEYTGPGVKTLSVPERATITNQGTELGALSSLFPSDEQTYRFLRAQGRPGDFKPLLPDQDAIYDETMDLMLDELEPLIALPSSPDSIQTVESMAGTPIDQVCMGSCTNSSYEELARVACILKGKEIHPRTSVMLSPGSRQVLQMLSSSGHLNAILESGVRLLECACGPCIGMGGAPGTNWLSLRSFNRNFPGRSGTQGDQVYLASNVICAASALQGKIVNPRELGTLYRSRPAKTYPVNLSDFSFPLAFKQALQVKIERGPNIQPLPRMRSLSNRLDARILIKLGDNISTDDIMPAGAKILPLRSNLPAISQYVFCRIDDTFPQRAMEAKTGMIVAGHNYGQGSSREHAALAPMYLGIRAVLVKSFARIHRSNLISFGIVPLLFSNEDDYDRIQQGSTLVIENLSRLVKHNETHLLGFLNGTPIRFALDLIPGERETLLAGGLLSRLKKRATAKIKSKGSA